METTEAQPRETSTGNGAVTPRLARKKFDPTQLFAQRDPLYREVADIIVNSPGGSIGHLVKLVERELQKLCAA